MDGERFDAIARAVEGAASRRTALRLAGAGLMAALGLAAADVDAKKKKKKNKCATGKSRCVVGKGKKKKKLCPGTCNDRPVCGDGCTCGTTVEGKAFCTSGASCGAQKCAKTSDCPDGHACSQGCCSEPICIPACAGACTPDADSKTCKGKCGPVKNNCGQTVTCGGCGANEVCNGGVCLPDAGPISCPSCGTCQRYDITVKSKGTNTLSPSACNENCALDTLCSAAGADSDFDRLHRSLTTRGFAVAGAAYAIEVDDEGTPDASIMIVPFENSRTGEKAGLAYGKLSTGGSSVPIAVIGDKNESPTLALVVDSGQIKEIQPAASPSVARKSGKARPAASGKPWTCRRCSNYCKFASTLGGIGIGVALAVIAVGTGGVGAVAIALAGGAFALGGFAAGEFCPSWCDCVYCACNDTCYTSATECTSNCRAGLGCISPRICAPAEIGDC